MFNKINYKRIPKNWISKTIFAMQSEEVEGSNIFPFPIGFVAKKGSSNG